MIPVKHVNPGLDVTVTPPGCVIDDSYRERKQPKENDLYIISEEQLNEIVGFQIFAKPTLIREIRQHKYNPDQLQQRIADVIVCLEAMKSEVKLRGSIGPMCNAYDGKAIAYGEAIALLLDVQP